MTRLPQLAVGPALRVLPLRSAIVVAPCLWPSALKVALPVAALALYGAPHAFWAPLVARAT